MSWTTTMTKQTRTTLTAKRSVRELHYLTIAVVSAVVAIILAIYFPLTSYVFEGNPTTLPTHSVHKHLVHPSKVPMGRTPVYFLSHGGPNIMEDVKHPAYAKLQEIGREITQQVKPKAVVVFSAHWQAEPNAVEVNTAEMNPLIYDYYGFPDHYYKVQYPNVGNKALAESVLSRLKSAGINANGVKRGLDHGVFAPFTVAFDPEKNPLNVPIIQVSLFDTDDADQHYRLGQALESLRDEGVQIIVSGMAVHNLRDMWAAMSKPTPMPYAVSFDTAIKEAVEQAPATRQAAMAALLERPDARRAHPSFEHLLPIHIGAGAAGRDMGKQLWTLPQGSMSWAQYRFGNVQAA